jgi:hypothetical protein
VATLHTPWSALGRIWRLPPEAVIALPSPGGPLFRIVTNDPPRREDFKPLSASYAERTGRSELLRCGLSHFLEPEQAATWMWKEEQLIARIVLPADSRIYVARTDQDRPGHVDVWCPGDLIDSLLESAEIVEVEL